MYFNSLLAAEPLSIDLIYQHLLQVYPHYKGITYDKPSVNYIDSDHWLLQLPNIWGTSFETYNQGFIPASGQTVDKNFFVPTCDTQSDCYGVGICQTSLFSLNKRKLCLMPAHDFLNYFYHSLTEAQSSVDIITGGMPVVSDHAFTTVLKNALITLAHKSTDPLHPIRIRLLEGSYIPYGLLSDPSPQYKGEIERLYTYFEELVKDLPKKNNLIISIANERSCEFKFNCGNHNDLHALELSFSWNHGKIINIDNSKIITGGETLSGQDYFEVNPVHDLAVAISGSVAKGAAKFIDTLWTYVKNNPFPTVNYCYTYQKGVISKICPESAPPSPVADKDYLKENPLLLSVDAMFISKLNNGVGLGDDADQSEIARVFAMKQASHSIKISQQALFSNSIGLPIPFSTRLLRPLGTPDGNLLQALAYAIHEKAVNVYIVTSHFKQIGSYSSEVNLKYIHDYLLNSLISDFHVDSQRARLELEQHLYLAYIGLTQAVDANIYSHHKFWMIDDKIFYIGSHNIYPASLQEFGLIIESSSAAKILLNTFWDPMWKYAEKYTSY